MQSKSNSLVILVTVIVTALIVGSGVYYLQNTVSSNQDQIEEMQKNVTALQNELKDLKQDSTQPDKTTRLESTSPQNEEIEKAQFDNMDGYVSLVMNTSTNSKYKTSKPAGYKRVNFGGIELNVALDGVSADVFVLESPNRSNDMDAIETFYLEVVGPSPCWYESDCDEPNTIDYYGPFKGKLGRLTE